MNFQSAMPSFTAVALDTLLERKEQKSISKPPSPPRRLEVGGSSRQKNIRPNYVSPSLYATPETTALPDSPTSFSPSPYVVSHKRRGPRLQKSHSDCDVIQAQTSSKEVEAAENGQASSSEQGVDCLEDVSASSQDESFVHQLHRSPKVSGSLGQAVGNSLKDAPNLSGFQAEASANRFHDKADPGNELSRINSSAARPLVIDSEKESDFDDFYEPQESMSVASLSENEGMGTADRSLKQSIAYGEFFDACEDLSSDGNLYSTCQDVESELREMSLNLLMEIEKRKQAEESLQNLQNQWKKMKQNLAQVGLILPLLLETGKDDTVDDNDPAEDVCQQVHIARLVATAVGRASARAEIEAEMETQIAAKNFEIARLGDRLQYSEAVNREMSQRNQEIVEMNRRQRHGRKRRQVWLWSSIGVAVLLGSAALAWVFLPSEASERLPPESSGDH